MANQSLFVAAFVYLVAAVISVTIAKRVGLSAMLGYLVAGMAIGPFGLGLVGEEGQDVMHFAEFGVVMMLFLIGLELRPSLLWRLRGPILGLGGGQVVLTAAAIFGIAAFVGLTWQMALAIGLALALSSTAIVLQGLQEKNLSNTSGGRSAFSVLLFQDIAVIPMLAVFPLLATLTPAGAGDGHGDHGHGASAFQEWLSHQAPWVNTLLVLGAVVAIILAGRYVVQPALRLVAATRVREAFVALALLLVIGIALLMSSLGVSAALGTFLAGVVLADSEYRHELEADIEPFKGLLLGVFFIAVGASVDFALIADKPGVVGGIVIGLMVLKAAILLVLGFFGKLQLDQRFLFALSRPHHFELINDGIARTVHQHAGSAIELARGALEELGYRAHRANRLAQAFAKFDREAAIEIAAVHKDETAFATQVRRSITEIEDQFEEDRLSIAPSVDDAWDNTQLRKNGVRS